MLKERAVQARKEAEVLEEQAKALPPLSAIRGASDPPHSLPPTHVEVVLPDTVARRITAPTLPHVNHLTRGAVINRLSHLSAQLPSSFR